MALPAKVTNHTIRNHPERQHIERAILAAQLSDRKIAERFTSPARPISPSMVTRYREELHDLVRISQSARNMEAAGEARTRLKELEAHIDEGITMAKADKDARGLAQMLGQAHKNVELLGQLTGEFNRVDPADTKQPLQILIGMPKRLANGMTNYPSLTIRRGGEEETIDIDLAAEPIVSSSGEVIDVDETVDETFIDSLEDVERNQLEDLDNPDDEAKA
jgi:hypothetical protein